MKNAHSRGRPKKAPALARCGVKQSDSDSDSESDFDGTLILRDRPRSDLSFFGAPARERSDLKQSDSDSDSDSDFDLIPRDKP